MLGIKKLKKKISELEYENEKIKSELRLLEIENKAIEVANRLEREKCNTRDYEIIRLKEENFKMRTKGNKLEEKLENLKSSTAECFSTSELVDILKERVGVSTLEIDVESRIRATEEGPMTILKIID